MRLVGRAVGVDDQVQPGLGDFQFAQQQARAQEAQHAQPHAQAANLGVRGFARSFQAVDDQPVRLGLQMEQTPVKKGDFHPSAGGSLDFAHHFPADKVLKTGGTG